MARTQVDYKTAVAEFMVLAEDLFQNVVVAKPAEGVKPAIKVNGWQWIERAMLRCIETNTMTVEE